MRNRNSFFVIFSVLILLVATSCAKAETVDSSPALDEDMTTTTTQAYDVSATDDREEKAVIIGQMITEESEGLLQVVRADVPLHGQTSGGHNYYGAHYRVVVLHSVHDLTSEQLGEINHLVAKIFEITTKEILRENTDVTHMGVQVLYPEIWSIGFAGTDSADPSAVYVASRRDLMGVLDSNLATTEKFISVAQEEKVFIVRESQLQ